MKKLLMILAALIPLFLFTNTVNAQKRIKVSDGVYLVTYGNVTVLENDNTQQTIQIKVTKSDNLYDVFCGNQTVKRVTKAVLKNTIKALLTKATLGLSWVGGIVIDEAVNITYDSVCNYFGEK